MDNEQYNIKILMKFAGLDMTRSFTLDFWLDDGWYIGQLREIPGVFSQGESLEALKTNILDAYCLMMQDAMWELLVRR